MPRQLLHRWVWTEWQCCFLNKQIELELDSLIGSISKIRIFRKFYLRKLKILITSWNSDSSIYFFDSSLWNWRLLYCRHKVVLNPSVFFAYSGQEDTVYRRNWKPLMETYIYTKAESVAKVNLGWLPAPWLLYRKLHIQRQRWTYDL